MRAALSAAAALLIVAPASAQVIDSVDAIGAFLDACVSRRLKGQGFSGRRDVTLRLSFRRDGSIIGQPVVTYSNPRQAEPEQARFVAVMRGSFTQCAPLPFSNGLGGAIAGKIFTFRYTLTDAKDQTI